MLTFNQKPEWFKHLADMTERNEHGYRLYEIALTCQQEAKEQGEGWDEVVFGIYADEFAEINKTHEREGSLSLKMLIRRSAIAGSFFKEIAAVFGGDVAKRIQKA